jgi:hypothetical protein
MAIVQLEGLGKLKKFIHLIGNQTDDLPACSIVPQPAILPLAPQVLYYKSKFFIKYQGLSTIMD